MQTAKQLMTTAIISVTPDTTVKELAEILSKNQISGAPVLNSEGGLFGVVTENDLIDQSKKLHIPTVITILDSFFFLENPDKMDKEMKKIAGATVADICSTQVITVGPDAPLEDIATIMAEKKVHTLPVVSDDELVGIIGRKDIIRGLIA
ncbi:MAG: CBS domain-containing protein [Desulfobulbaceae bacterium]|uniref:CBS domain-containing protein n=1 Tax=Candidatus Desulfatifera sulfidica TaxID=2841691 RepID=A0A8J6TCV6_9BACT|nr:CBS domain-containing protein [Candidatus Desulfatifera sulfidica]